MFEIITNNLYDFIFQKTKLGEWMQYEQNTSKLNHTDNRLTDIQNTIFLNSKTLTTDIVSKKYTQISNVHIIFSYNKYHLL